MIGADCEAFLELGFGVIDDERFGVNHPSTAIPDSIGFV
jgi:hypothetical protein